MAPLIAALLLAALAETAADPNLTNDALTATCATQKCRPARTLIVSSQGKPYQTQQPALPFVAGDNIIVVAGDEFDVEVDWGANGAPAHVSLPGATPRPDHTVHISFTQSDTGFMLSLKNGTGSTFKYDARMELPEHGLVSTSACAVGAGISAFEMWSDPIFKLVLSNLRALPDRSSISCN